MADWFGPDDDASASHLPPAHARAWRHPSELGRPVAAPTPTPPARTPRHFSSTSVVLAAAFGALAMLATLNVTSVLGVDGAANNSGGLIDSTSTGSALTPTHGIVTIRDGSGSEQVHGAGLVVDRHGDIVTAMDLTEARESDALGAVPDLSVRTVDGDWTPVEVVGDDARTGLTVLRLTHGAETVPADVAEVALGRSVHTARASSTTNPVVVSGDRGERVVGINASVDAGLHPRIGLVRITTSTPDSLVDLVVDAQDGRVVALGAGIDDIRGDNLAYAVPADVATEIGRQIVLDGRAAHGDLDAVLDNDAQGVVVIMVLPESNAEAAGLVPGDIISAVANRPVQSPDDVGGALLGVGIDEVDVEVIRDSKTLTLRVETVPATPRTMAMMSGGAE